MIAVKKNMCQSVVHNQSQRPLFSELELICLLLRFWHLWPSSSANAKTTKQLE